jgi:hypothetical protein
MTRIFCIIHVSQGTVPTSSFDQYGIYPNAPKVNGTAMMENRSATFSAAQGGLKWRVSLNVH